MPSDRPNRARAHSKTAAAETRPDRFQPPPYLSRQGNHHAACRAKQTSHPPTRRLFVLRHRVRRHAAADGNRKPNMSSNRVQRDKPFMELLTFRVRRDAVAAPWPAHRNRADPSLHFAFGLVTVAHHTTAPSLVREVGVRGNRKPRPPPPPHRPANDAHLIAALASVDLRSKSDLDEKTKQPYLRTWRILPSWKWRLLNHRQDTPPLLHPITKIQLYSPLIKWLFPALTPR